MISFTQKYNRKLKNRVNDFSGSFMNDSKWSKLFKALSLQNIAKKCLIKDVMDDYLRELEIPAIEQYSMTFNEKGINDIMIGGPSNFKSIEHIEFPKEWTIERKMRTETLTPKKQEQNIDQIEKLIKTVGNFEMDCNYEKIVLYGYR
ncbi:MAG: hypothetical protein L3J06_06325 [Cyclobacteriaceae bacterium]|nr:hypothetical protein [Cyclobacteriaceae bacterium]